MNICKNIEPIKPGKRYFLEIVALDEQNFFSINPYGRLKLTPSQIRTLHTTEPALPPFNRCKDCSHAHPVGSRNVTCKKNPTLTWSKMSKACEQFEQRKEEE